MKIVIFTTMKILSILHGHVCVMICAHNGYLPRSQYLTAILTIKLCRRALYVLRSALTYDGVVVPFHQSTWNKILASPNKWNNYSGSDNENVLY